MIGFGVLGFAIDLDGSDGRFLYYIGKHIKYKTRTKQTEGE